MESGEESRRRLSVTAQLWVTCTNVALAAVKLSIGAVAGSPALVASGAEHLTDLLSSFVGWLGHREAQKPPDEDHHYGHGNAEALAAIGIGILILGAGTAIVVGTFVGGGSTEAGLAGGLALGTAGVSAVVCELLSRYVHRISRETGSQVLAALGRDKRADALTSLVVVVGVAGSLIGLGWLEPVVAVLMGCLIVYLGLRSVLEGLDVLMDRVSDPALREEVAKVAVEVEGVRDVHSVRVHPLGATYRVDLEIGVDGELSVREGHEIADQVERAVRTRRDRVVQVHVHVNPR